MPELLRAVGLMSGTSRDGIDAALLVSDGVDVVTTGLALTRPYTPDFRRRLAGGIAQARAGAPAVGGALAELGRELTDLHAEVVGELLSAAHVEMQAIDVIGFSGHTILHQPRRGLTWQLGDGARLAAATGRPVVGDFRARDVAAGGEGAPLAPIYHYARYRACRDRRNPVAILNLGGIANVTWLDADRPPEEGIVAFDCGPGNALIDDWTMAQTGRPFDEGGHLARAGRVDEAVLNRLLAHPFFAEPPPKSLDRDDFSLEAVAGLAPADGAATLTALTVAAAAAAQQHFPAPVTACYVSGGGRHNAVIMAGLEQSLGVLVAPVEALGWDGDALEAELFAYLAIRSLRGLPLSFPGTTGVPVAMSGGIRFDP